MRSSFDAWQKEVSHELYVTEGVSLEECPDFHWWIYFNNGLTAEEAIRKFLLWEEPDDQTNLHEMPVRSDATTE